MIRVDVEGYCQSCLDFSPDVAKPIRVTTSGGEITFTDTVIQCEYRKRCAGIKRFLDQQMRGDDQSERTT